MKKTVRETLIRKRFGVPALFLIAILLTAGSIAAFSVASFNCTTTTSEPLTFSKADALDIPKQGESDDITVTAINHSESVTYGILVDTGVADSKVESVSYSKTNLIASEPAEGRDINGDGDKVDAAYNIGPSGSFDIVVTIDTADDAAPGDMRVILDFQRVSEYE